MPLRTISIFHLDARVYLFILMGLLAGLMSTPYAYSGEREIRVGIYNFEPLVAVVEVDGSIV